MTTDARNAASGSRGSRALKPGSRTLYLAAVLGAIAIAVIVVVAIQPGGGSRGTIASKFRVVPNDAIARPAAPKIVTATAKHPDLTQMQGYPVNAKLANGSARVFMEGPVEPSWVQTEAGNGTLKASQTVPGTFEVTFSHVSGTVPLSAADFSIVTYDGTILFPKITTSTGAALPSSIPAGKSLTLKLSVSGLSEGDGAIRWAPIGRKTLVSYFWTLELD